MVCITSIFRKDFKLIDTVDNDLRNNQQDVKKTDKKGNLRKLLGIPEYQSSYSGESLSFDYNIGVS